MEVIESLSQLSISTCFGSHYAHLKRKRLCIAACGVLHLLCWLWLCAHNHVHLIAQSVQRHAMRCTVLGSNTGVSNIFHNRLERPWAHTAS